MYPGGRSGRESALRGTLSAWRGPGLRRRSRMRSWTLPTSRRRVILDRRRCAHGCGSGTPPPRSTRLFMRGPSVRRRSASSWPGRRTAPGCGHPRSARRHDSQPMSIISPGAWRVTVGAARVSRTRPRRSPETRTTRRPIAGLSQPGTPAATTAQAGTSESATGCVASGITDIFE